MLKQCIQEKVREMEIIINRSNTFIDLGLSDYFASYENLSSSSACRIGLKEIPISIKIPENLNNN